MKAESTLDQTPDPDPELVGKRIQLRLDQIGMRPAELARRVGSNPTVVWKWLTGVHVPSLRKLRQIARVLHPTTADELLAPALPEAPDEAPPTPEEELKIDEVVPPVHTAEHRRIALRALRLQAADDARKNDEAAHAALTLVPSVNPAPESSAPPPPRRRRGARTA